MACNCTDLSYNFVNCFLDIICDGRIIHSINMDKAAIKNYGINGDVEISPCCGEIVKLSQVNLDQLNLTIVDLQNFRSQCAAAAASAQDYEAGNYTLLCDSLDANISYLAYYTFTDGVKENHYITLPSGVDAIGDLPATAMQCKEAKIVHNCFKVGSEIWYNLICLQGLNIVGNIWVNTETGVAQTTAPSGAVPCEEKDKLLNTYCYRAVINGTGYSTGDIVEFKQVFDANNPMSPEFMIWINKNTLQPVFISDTINPSNNTGTFPNVSDFIPCEYIPCKKEIIATHDRYFLASSIPSNLTAYQLSSTLNTNGGNATNMYLHLIYGVLNGSAVDPPLGSDLQDYFATPHTGVLFTDISTIQSIVNAILPQIGLLVGDAIYAVNTDNEPIWFLSQSAINELTNSTYLHIYFGSDSTWNSYTQKADVSVLATNSNILLGGSGYTCINVQEIKEKDTCTGLETYRFVTEDGNGNLVDASTLSGWDETKLLGECPKLLEKEICATIDGSTDSYYLDMVYILDPFTADIIPVKYFDKKGNKVTGAIERVCCTCSTLCEIIQNNNPIPNIKCAGYAASFDPNLSQSLFMQGFGRYSQPFWDGSCGAGTVTGFTWELDSFIHNGVEQLTSPMIVTVPFSSMTLTASGVPTNYANAFNVLLNTKGINLDPDMAVKSYVNGDTFVIAFRQYANPIACSAPPSSRLEIVTESGDGWEYMPTSNPTLAQIQAFTAAGNFTSLATNSACQAI